MFTGLVETTGLLVARRIATDGVLWLETPDSFVADLKVGDSICVEGVCLTALDLHDNGFRVDLSAETLQRSTLGMLPLGARLNLEKSLRPNDRLGGHFVTGHVDTLAKLESRPGYGAAQQWVFSVSEQFHRMIASKGSVTLNGVSLTVNSVVGRQFSVNLIPHTLAITTFSDLEPGAAVNLEVDLLARYLLRWRETGGPLDDPFSAGDAGSTA